MPTWYEYEREADEIDDLFVSEKKRKYQRVCKRCNAIYHSYIRSSRYCPKCYKGTHFNEVFGKMKKEAKKNETL